MRHFPRLSIVVSDHRDLYLLRDTRCKERRRFGLTTSRRTSMGALLMIENAVDATVFNIGLEPAGAARLVGLVWVGAGFATGKGTTELIGAREFATGHLADGGDDQRANTRDRRGDDNDCVLDVAPADQFNTAAGSDVGDAG